MRRKTQEPSLQTAQQLLAQAGIAAIEVESCDDIGCRWCAPQPLPLAA